MSNPFEGLDPNNPHDIVSAARKVGLSDDQLRQVMPQIEPYLGDSSQSEYSLSDIPVTLSKGAMQANKMVVDTLSFLGNKVNPNFSKDPSQPIMFNSPMTGPVTITRGLDSISDFFDRGIESGTAVQSDRLQAEMSRPIYHEGTGEWQAPSIGQVAGITGETLPMLPMMAGTGGAVARGLQGVGVGARTATMAGYGLPNAALIGGDTYGETKDAVHQDLAKNNTKNLSEQEIDLLAEDVAQSAGNIGAGVGLVTGALGLGIPAVRTVSKPASGLVARTGNAGLGAFTEGVSEFVEEGAQGAAVNAGRIEAGNQNVDLMDGVIDRGAKGMIGGAAMGGTFGAMNNQAEWERVKPQDDIYVNDEKTEISGADQTVKPEVQDDNSVQPFDLNKLSTDELLDLASQIDAPMIKEVAIPVREDMPEEAFRGSVMNIINRTDDYHRARRAWNRQQAEEKSQVNRSRERIAEIKQERKEQYTSDLRQQRNDLRSNVMFTLARNQQQGQQRRQEEADQRKEDIVNRVDRPSSGFTGMAEREQQVAKDSNKRQWQGMAAQVKSARKRFKKKLAIANASKRAQLEMDRFYNKLEKDKAAQQAEVDRLDWEQTNMARSYRMAQEIGLDQEFNKLALAVRHGIQMLPEQERQRNAEAAETALTEWVEEEYAGSNRDTGDSGITTTRGGLGDINEVGSTGNTPLAEQSGEVEAGRNDDVTGQPSGRVGQVGSLVDGRSGNDDALTAGQKQAERQARINNAAKKYVGKLHGHSRQDTQMVMGDGFSELDALSIVAEANRLEMESRTKATSEFDAKANEAATSPTNDLPEPTEAQKEAGNYKKGKVRLHGMDISIENPKGSTRSGTDANGKKWQTKMQHHYGDIKGTKGADGDSIDTFIGESHDSQKVFVVDQVDPESGAFDEHKVMLGFDNVEDATKGYQSNYDKGWKGLGAITETTVDEFKQWMTRPRKSKQPFAKVDKVETSPTDQTLRNILFNAIRDGVEPKNNIALKKLIAEKTGRKFSDISLGEQKSAQEEFEGAMAQWANKLAEAQGDNVKGALHRMIIKYGKQPNLNVKTASSTKNQAYSTPAPVAYLLNKVAGINNETTVLEPTAGNGLLLITNNRDLTTVNEIDSRRVEQLNWLGYKNIQSKDATGQVVPPKSQDVVIMNPPFGFSANSKAFESVDGSTYTMKDIDHIIAIEQLKAMKDDGRAVLVLGANKEPGITQRGKTRTFLNFLYSNYNVVDHVELDGKVYERQGAAWPIRLITIHGRKATGKFAPLDGEVTRITGDSAADIINSLYDRYRENGLLDPANQSVNDRGTSNGGMRTASQRNTDSAGNKPSDRSQTSESNAGSKLSDTAPDGRSNGKPGTDQSTGQQRTTGEGAKNRSGKSGNDTGSGKRKPALAKQSEPYQPKRSSVDRSRIDTNNAVKRLTSPTKATEFQADYSPGSDGFNEGVLIPVNMASKVQKALLNFIEEHGSIDGYVAEKLGYDSIKSLHKSFMGLQVDAAALAISKMDKGKAIIIADQTGVGKGRQAAAVIRYALQQGKVPVFLSQKPNLFSDMYGDLMDIDTQGVNPVIFNSGESIIHDGKVVVKQPDKDVKKSIDAIAKGEMPAGKNAIFLTYSQVNVPNKKRNALKSIADKAVFILDESHTGAGSDSQTGEFLRDLLQEAYGVTYLSATYAKRSDNLGLYHRTSLGDAAESMEELQDAIDQGGLQLQTLLSSMLSEEGELIRRERSFEGISINTKVDTQSTARHEALFNASTDILQDIIVMSRSFVKQIKRKSKEAEKNGVSFIGNTTLEKDVKATSFTSVVHNYISQLTMALKADSAADAAINSIKQGKKPVIALESTMESKLNDYMEANGLVVGDSASDFTFGDVFETAISNALSVSQKDPNGEVKKIQIPFEQLPSATQSTVRKIRNKIQSATLLKDIPVSPIDHIRKRISDAGYTVSEITGRKKYIDYNDNMRIVNKPVEESKQNRRRIVDRFNSGKLDAMILNQSGSTGLSAHASEKFPDKKPRHMVVAQPSLDINTFMQMLGRINRTGQVEKPSYDLLWLNLPSENRPAAVLSNKMKKLNANTSANTDSATSVESVDLFNVYGDQVVTEYLNENPDLLDMLGVGIPEQDVAQYITGKLAVLPVHKQREFFEDVEPMYKDLVDHLKAIGEYRLDTQEIDLQAEPLEQTILHRGSNKSVFDSDVRLTKIRAKKQGKPVSVEELQEAYESVDRSASGELAESLTDDFNKFIDSFQLRINDANDALAKARETGEEDSAVELLQDEVSALNKRKAEIEANRDEVRRYLKFKVTEGNSVKVETADGDIIYGMITGIKHKASKNGNPFSPSNFKVRLLTAGGTSNMTVSLSQLMKDGMDKVGTISYMNLKNLFQAEFNKPQFETRYIATGNLVKAFAMMDGRVISFTKADGGKEIGMLMKRDFNPNKDVKSKVYVKDLDQALDYLDKADRVYAVAGLSTGDGFAINLRDGDIRVIVPVNNADNRKKYLDDKVISILGEEPTWRKGEKAVSVIVSKSQLKQLHDHLSPVFILEDSAAQHYEDTTGGGNTEQVANSDIRFNKSDRPVKSGVPVKSAKLALNKFIAHYKGLNDEGFKFKITDQKPSELFGSEQVGVDGDRAIKGGFDKDTNTLFIFTENHESIDDIRRTIREELLVHKGLGVFSQEEIGQLITRINDTRNSNQKRVREIWEDVARNYAGLPPLHQAEEFLGKVAQKRPSFLDKWMNKLLAQITKMFRAIGLYKQSISLSEMRSEVYRIGELLMKGKTTDNQSFDVQGAVGVGVRFRKGDSNRGLKKTAKDKLSSLMDNLGRKAVFKMLPINQMADMYDKQYTNGHIGKYYDLLEAFGAYKAKRLSGLDEGIETRWDELQKENPKANIVVSRTMVNATMAQLSPDKAFDDQQLVGEIRTKIENIQMSPRVTERQAAYLDDLHNKLADLKDLYKQIRDDWRWLEKNEPRAIDLYKEVRQEYVDTYNETKRALITRIAELQTDEATRKALMSMVKVQFEKKIQKGDYFPLMRNGDFAVIARKNDEYIREHFETSGEAKLAQERYEGLGFTVSRQKMGSIDSNAPLQGYAMGAEIIRRVKEMSGENFDPFTKNELDDSVEQVNAMADLFKSLPDQLEADQLIDTIYQEMLRSLPNASAAKHFIHRNRTKGASNDSRRAFANTMFHSINRIAKIQFEHKFAEQLGAIRDLADNSNGNSQHVVRDIHESLRERNNKTLNPDGGPVAAFLSGVGFNWLLGGSVAAGAVNLSQVPLVTFPYLSSKYGNKKAMGAIASAYGEMKNAGVNVKRNKQGKRSLWRTISQSDSLLDISKSRNLTEQEARILNELADAGKIDLTQMHSMAQIADTEMRDNHGFRLPFTNKSINKKSFVDIQRAWGFFFHNAEVVNRQVTALASIRLAKEQNPKLNDNQLSEIAAKAIDETQFNYASYNRGMWAREDFGKIALMFMTYTVNIITLMAKNTRRMFAGDAEARKFMVNMMGAHFLAAGAIGLPLVEAVGDLLFMLKDATDDDDEPDDFKKWMDETIRQSVTIFGGDPNGDAAHMASTITRKGIINGLTGINVADRVGLNNLIWRSDNNVDSTGTEVVSNMLMGVSPIFSIAANIMNGAQRMGAGLEQNDDELFLRGVQGVVPKAVGDLAKAYRQFNYGESTLLGTELISPQEISAWNALVQATGFSNEKVRDMYERRSTEYRYDKLVAVKKQTLIRLAANAIQNNEDMESILERIEAFNEANPGMAITPDTIRRHILAKARRQQQTIDGIYTPKSKMGKEGEMQYYDN